MADISLDLGDLDRLIGKLETAGRDATRRVGNAVRETTQEGVRIAKSEAPVDTGRLRSEIDGVATTLSGLITSHAPYSGWVDRGTSRRAPNAYMGRTATRLEQVFRDQIGNAGRPDF